jgi:hypothetical protein
MGSFVQHGGYIVTTPTKNYVSELPVSQSTLLQIAALLGIEPADISKLKSETIRTMFIYAPAEDISKTE